MKPSRESRSRRLRRLVKAGGDVKDTRGLDDDGNRSASEVRKMAEAAREHARAGERRVAKTRSEIEKTNRDILNSRQAMERALSTLSALLPKKSRG